MAVTIANLDNNVATSFPHTTPSITWTPGALGVVSVAVATSSVSDIDIITVTGGGVTWTQKALINNWGQRRALAVFVSPSTPTDGTLEIDFTPDAGTKQEIMYSVDECAGYDTGTPTDAATSATVASGAGTSLNLPDIGTIDAGDLGIAVFGFENGADSFGPATGSSTHILRTGGANVRSFLVATTTTDDTPGATWATNSYSCGGIGFVVNVGAAPGGGAGVIGHSIIAKSLITHSAIVGARK